MSIESNLMSAHDKHFELVCCVLLFEGLKTIKIIKRWVNFPLKTVQVFLLAVVRHLVGLVDDPFPSLAVGHEAIFVFVLLDELVAKVFEFIDVMVVAHNLPIDSRLQFEEMLVNIPVLDNTFIVFNHAMQLGSQLDGIFIF